jgi:hypothetical protein
LSPFFVARRVFGKLATPARRAMLDELCESVEKLFADFERDVGKWRAG